VDLDSLWLNYSHSSWLFISSTQGNHDLAIVCWTGQAWQSISLLCQLRYSPFWTHIQMSATVQWVWPTIHNQMASPKGLTNAWKHTCVVSSVPLRLNGTSGFIFLSIGTMLVGTLQLAALCYRLSMVAPLGISELLWSLPVRPLVYLTSFRPRHQCKAGFSSSFCVPSDVWINK
jgi:hypothetical protein